MANAILLNQSTELTKENILSKLGTGLITNIENRNDRTNAEFAYKILNQDGNETEHTIQFSQAIDQLIYDKNYITYDDDTDYEEVE